MVVDKGAGSARSDGEQRVDKSRGVAKRSTRGGVRFKIRRAYGLANPGDGYRVLVDRLWPRGISKRDAALDEWAKDLAPGSELRRWYGHDPARFEEFARRYRTELKQAPAREAVARLRAAARDNQITLVTATRDIEHSGARVLLDVLTGRV
jgi:uncharacterized protein YeaO (DUF488 family)